MTKWVKRPNGNFREIPGPNIPYPKERVLPPPQLEAEFFMNILTNKGKTLYYSDGEQARAVYVACLWRKLNYAPTYDEVTVGEPVYEGPAKWSVRLDRK